jgi:hypothetical protein
MAPLAPVTATTILRLRGTADLAALTKPNSLKTGRDWQAFLFRFQNNRFQFY